jgi:perosamine synthetase
MRAGNFSIADQILNTFKFMKSGKTLTETQLRSLELKDNRNITIGYAVPVGEFFKDDEKLIEKLAEWRETFAYAYPTRFKVTLEGTRKWLNIGVIENPDQILFLIQNAQGETIGNVGLVRMEPDRVELGNLIKDNGESFANLKIVAAAIKAVESFCYNEIGIEVWEGRVLASNKSAVAFWAKIGFEEVRRYGLKNIGQNEDVILVESETDVVDTFIFIKKDLSDANPIPDQILTAGPSISNRELTYVADATVKGWNNNHSDYLTKFQVDFAEYVGAKYALATSSCTGALHLSLLALGIGPGDEVIVPEVTWVATASAVRYVGATPIFADIDPKTWCIDLKSVEEKVTSKTKAIMPVHLYGFGSDMTSITKFAKERNISIVEDAAPAIGTLIDGKPAGSFGEFGAYSFQGAKMLVTGEGGMLVTSDPELFERARKIQDHGRKPGTFWIEEIGYKYKMNNITAALGLAQLERSERQIEQKRRIATWYQEALGANPKLTMQVEASSTRSIHWMNSITLANDVAITRDEVMEKLKTDGIDTRPVFPAISQYPIWDKSHVPGEVATRIGAQSINLPSGVKLSKKSVQKVCDAINSLIG